MILAKPVLLVALLLALLEHHVQSQFPEANWSPVPVGAFAVPDKYPSSMPDPATALGYNWSLPYPDSPLGNWPDNTGCNYSDPYVSGLPGRTSHLPMQIYDASGNLQTGTIQRTNPAYLYRTTILSEVRGFALQARFTGDGGGADGQNLYQAAFYHSQRCYGAATEVGFFRQVGPGDDAVVFYYNINANCSPLGKCRVQRPGGAWETLQEQTDGLSIPIPPGGAEWLYAAWLSSDETTWNMVRRDPAYPYTIRASWSRPVQSWFSKYAHEMRNGAGLSGYVTLTSQIDGPFSSPAASAMDVVAVFTPFWRQNEKRPH